MPYTPTPSNPFLMQYGESDVGRLPIAESVKPKIGMDLSQFGDSQTTFNGLDIQNTGQNYNTKWGDMGAYGKMATIGQGVSAFGTLAQLYLGFKAMSAQKKQFNFQKDAWNKGFDASLKDYDNQLRDQYRRQSQGEAFFGRDFQSLDSYLAERSLRPGTAAPNALPKPAASGAQPLVRQQPNANNMDYDKRRLIGV